MRTELTLSADEDARADQGHAGDGHDHPKPLHRAPLYMDGEQYYNAFGPESM